MIASPETVDEAEHLILAALHEEPTVSLKFFDDGCDSRLFSAAAARLTRAGIVDVRNGHVSLSHTALHREPEETPVNTAVLNRIADALESIADKLGSGEPNAAPKATAKSAAELRPAPTAKATLLPVVAMPRRPAGRPRKPKPGDTKRIESTMTMVLDLLSGGPATDAELREVLPDEQRQLLYPAMVRAVERGLVTCHRVGKIDRFSLTGTDAVRRTA